MNIFVACSKKTASIEGAEQIQSALQTILQGQNIEHSVTSTTDDAPLPGQQEFNSAIETAIGLDGAVVLLSGEDEQADRENLYIQYAILVGKLNAHRVILCCYGEVTLPPLLNGVIVLKWSVVNGKDATATKTLRRWVKSVSQKTVLETKDELEEELILILKRMLIRKTSHGYTTLSFLRYFLENHPITELSLVTVIDKLRKRKLIHEESIEGEPTFFITEHGITLAESYQTSLKTKIVGFKKVSESGDLERST
jgi:hypothetical protein